MRLVLATRNAHKLREFERLLARASSSMPLPDDVALPPEDGDDVRRERARSRRARRPPHRPPAIADDSGIEAAALGGAPGVRSARFAGEDATDAREPRQARCRGARRQPRSRYVCALALRRRRRRRSTLFEGALRRARWRDEPRGERRLRLRPGVRARRATTAARWPSCPPPRRTRSAIAAARRARCWPGCDAHDRDRCQRHGRRRRARPRSRSPRTRS